MKLKINLYVVFTEYQLLQAVNIATAVYGNNKFSNIIYVVRKGRRLNTIDASKVWQVNNLSLIILDNENPKTISRLIFAEKPNHFFFFQAISALNIYLAHTLSRKGVEISLGPDGYGVYANFNKRHHLLSIIKDSYKENLYLLKNKLFNGTLFKFDYYVYGNYSFIDNLWVTHPQQYVHHGKNKVKVLKLPDFNQSCLDFVQSCFNYDSEFPTHDVVYFFNQPLWPPLLKKEYEILKEVAAKFHDRKIVVKLHPLTKPETRLLYEAIRGVSIINSNVPAEVLLVHLKNCIVFTGWSSVLITENQQCNYYFTYPIFKKLGDKILDQLNIVPLNHIKMIHSPKEMTFLNE